MSAPKLVCQKDASSIQLAVNESAVREFNRALSQPESKKRL